MELLLLKEGRKNERKGHTKTNHDVSIQISPVVSCPHHPNIC